MFSAWAAEAILFPIAEHIHYARWSFIYNSNTFGTIGPLAGTENALESKCQSSKTVQNHALFKGSPSRGVFKHESRRGASDIRSHSAHCEFPPNFYLISSALKVCSDLKVSLVVAPVGSSRRCLFSQVLCMPERSPTAL